MKLTVPIAIISAFWHIVPVVAGFTADDDAIGTDYSPAFTEGLLER